MVSVVSVLFTSCQDNPYTGLGDFHSQSAPQKVGFYAGSGTQTRTEMLENGLSATWAADDRIALWAKGSSGSYALSNHHFGTYGIDFQRGYFTSELSSPMADDTYTYYCCYPVPTSVDGTKATFTMPAVQDGKASKGVDIMVATPAQHGALAPLPEVEDHSGMRLVMNRMMHQFRFYLPAEDTQMQGEAIEKIVLTFPAPVTGDVSVDVADPSAAPVLAGGDEKITLQLKEPISVEKGNYACVAFVPSSFTAGQSLQVKAYTSDKVVKIDPIDLRARNFQAGHSTPVILRVNDVVEYPYSITFRVAANNLGEGVNTIVLTAPSGCAWDTDGSNVYTYNPGHKINVGEEFVFRFEDEAQYRAFSGKSISVTYDSDNTITYQTVNLPNMNSTDKVSASLTVPYLFYEDFSGIPDFSDGHDNPTVGMGSDLYVGISEMSGWSMNGWYGARVGGQKGTAIRLCCRVQNVAKTAYYKGRIYTPFITNIKEGKDVNISVSFRYGSAKKEMRSSNAKAYLYFGINTLDEVLNPDDQDLIGGVIAGSGYGNSIPSSLSPMIINGEALSTSGGSYTSFDGMKTVKVENFDNHMRLSWIVSSDFSTTFANGNFWLYLDDIKVQIVD